MSAAATLLNQSSKPWSVPLLLYQKKLLKKKSFWWFSSGCGPQLDKDASLQCCVKRQTDRRSTYPPLKCFFFTSSLPALPVCSCPTPPSLSSGSRGTRHTIPLSGARTWKLKCWRFDSQVNFSLILKTKPCDGCNLLTPSTIFYEYLLPNMTFLSQAISSLLFHWKLLDWFIFRERDI